MIYYIRHSSITIISVANIFKQIYVVIRGLISIFMNISPRIKRNKDNRYLHTVNIYLLQQVEVDEYFPLQRITIAIKRRRKLMKKHFNNTIFEKAVFGKKISETFYEDIKIFATSVLTL